jgi:hypothetical protein
MDPERVARPLMVGVGGGVPDNRAKQIVRGFFIYIYSWGLIYTRYLYQHHLHHPGPGQVGGAR